MFRFVQRLGLGLFAAFCVSPVWADAKDDANEILETADVSAGFFVHLGVDDASLTKALRNADSVQVHGLQLDKTKVDANRQSIRKAGIYGAVSIDSFSGSELPYNDNLVNLIVASDSGDVSPNEMLRVLAPKGVALVRKEDGDWKKYTKNRPDNIDEWSHYLHDSTGNSVADDEVVAPPRHLQWVGSPRWSRHHDRMASMSALVSTNGRMFYVMDEGSRISIQLPPKWKLIARDAFNGSVLWKRDIGEWQSHLWPLKSGPTQLARRLVSTDNEVFVTLGYNSPLVALDAATGETLREYKDSDATEEIIHSGDKLFLVVRKGKAELQDYTPIHGRTGDQAQVRSIFWNEEPRVVMAFDAKSGKRLWESKTTISPLTLAAHEGQLFFHDGARVVSLDQKSGDLIWSSDPVTRRQSFTFNFGPRLVLYEDVVLYAGGDGKIKSLDAKSGEEHWSAEFPNSGYQSPQDLMVVDGLVWLAPLTSGKDTGVYTARDPKTGEVKKQFPPDVDTYWFHHRCYIAKATNNFLMPSRTGIEFVDPDKEHWDIHHWVRGGCLYGVMPCNGMTYAPPHNCACYPEAKLFGFNALAPTAPTRPVPAEVPEEGRLERGPAFATKLGPLAGEDSQDWPTYRHDQKRSGTTTLPLADKISPAWKTDLGGRLTQPVIAGGQVFVSQIDAHTLYALDESTGKENWTFTAGARIDSPPTIYRDRVVFGATDGWVYCLTKDGQLCWRYRGAPLDRRTMAFEQLESLWPVHGSVLIRDDVVHCVAGRSIFLDGGLRLLRLDLASGKKLSETLMDDKNPETGNNLQEKLQILQMPVGLPDILSCDDKHIFMKSQKFDLKGNRLEIGPNSGDFAAQASKQRGKDAHIFAPMGFLDDSWFHRSYWVLGQSFAGGHGGYYQAGRFAPSGRLLVQGNGYVYGYGRKPEYLRWTTTLEHQLFAAEQNPPEIPESFGKKNAGLGGSYVQVRSTPKLNPKGKPITIEAWVTTTKQQGVIVARGGPAQGYALTLKGGKPNFLVRAGDELSKVVGGKRIIGGWHHIVGVLAEDKSMKLYVDGQLAGEGKAKKLLTGDPAQPMEIGIDGGTAVGEYKSPFPLTGLVDEVRLYFAAATAEQIAERYENGNEISGDAVLALSFDDGTARDHSLARNDGTVAGATIAEGKFGKALKFSGKKKGGNNQPGNSLVDPKWTKDLPIYVRAMMLSGSKLYLAGPRDIIDEEETFEKLTEKDEAVQKLLAKQDAVLNGNEALLLIVNTDTGEIEQQVEVDSLPAWDALSGANGSLFLATQDGAVRCYGK